MAVKTYRTASQEKRPEGARSTAICPLTQRHITARAAADAGRFQMSFFN
jgi:hypothetical protein